jgi:hypothetical protein
MQLILGLLQVDMNSMDYSGGGSAGGGIAGAIFGLIYLAVIIAMIAGMWKTFAKANEPGWAAIIPIYNLVVLLKIVGRPVWWVVLYLLGIIPIVGGLVVIVVSFIVNIDLAKSFGKGAGFGVGLALLPFVFYPMLGFGDAQYSGPSASGATAAA